MIEGSVLSPVLVTGANGFIGSALCQALVKAGCCVRGLILKGTDPGMLPRLGVSVVAADICDPASLAEPVASVKTVFHLAALAKDWGRRTDFLAINAEGTRNVLDAAARAGVRRFVHMSSLAVHRFGGHLEADESTPANNRTFGYGESKIVAEGYVHEFQSRGKLQTTIIRPGAIIHGPGDTTSFIHLAPVLERGGLPLLGGGGQVTCYSYVENLAAGMLLAAASPQGAGETFILTDDIRITMKEHLTSICQALGAPARFSSIPVPVARAGGWVLDTLWRLARARNPPVAHRYRVGLVARNFHFSCGKAKRLLGYQPQVPYLEGLDRTVAWYRRWQSAPG